MRGRGRPHRTDKKSKADPATRGSKLFERFERGFAHVLSLFRDRKLGLQMSGAYKMIMPVRLIWFYGREVALSVREVLICDRLRQYIEFMKIDKYD